MPRQLEIYESVTFSFPFYHQQLNVVDSNQACLTMCELNMEYGTERLFYVVE
jgi:hypothetical protein